MILCTHMYPLKGISFMRFEVLIMVKMLMFDLLGCNVMVDTNISENHTGSILSAGRVSLSVYETVFLTGEQNLNDIYCTWWWSRWPKYPEWRWKVPSKLLIGYRVVDIGQTRHLVLWKKFLLHVERHKSYAALDWILCVYTMFSSIIFPSSFVIFFWHHFGHFFAAAVYVLNFLCHCLCIFDLIMS